MCHCVILLVYFCDQSVASEIRHSRRHCDVCQQSACHSCSDEDKILIKKHINALSIHSYARRGIKIGALKMQLVCIFSIAAEYLQNI